MASETVPFDPMDGCPQCRWLDTNIGRVLDQKCALHQKVEDLQSDLQLERHMRRCASDLLRRVCEALGADDEDDPERIARERMEEIRALEDELDRPSSPTA